MSDEVSAILANELAYYESRVTVLAIALENLLDPFLEHKRIVFKMIQQGYGKRDLLLARIRTLYRPSDVSPGLMLKRVLDELTRERLIESVEIKQGYGRGIRFVRRAA
jgi:hypothetical protein